MSHLSSFFVEKRRKLFAGLGVSAVAMLVTLGVFAANDWLPNTDALTGKKTGWFGKELPKNASSSWNPLAAPLPVPTPQLSKEYIYAGSRLLAVEDANATAAPPADLAIWRPSNGLWHVMGQPGSAATFYPSWGAPTDITVPGDYDGDGKTDFSVFRPSDGYWYIIKSSDSTGLYYSWGGGVDTPVPADYDGDGMTDPAITRPNATTGNLEWWIYASGGGLMSGTWGSHTDLPAPADFDGDGKADLGVFRDSDTGYYWVNSSDNSTNGIYMGQPTGSCPIPRNCIVSSDYDGDGKADRALYNSSNAGWTIHRSTDGNLSTQTWGNANDIPVQNDYDGDGKTDLATWRNSNAQWTIKRSSNGTTRTETFGQSGDIPVPALYRR